MDSNDTKSIIDNSSKIFIVTPSFNSQDTISRTIASVVSQAGNFDIYYHIQDGGSTDDTLSIIKKWEQLLTNGDYPILCNFIKLTYNSSPDKGMYDAIVKGFDNALPNENVWLSWINADDFYLQGAFATIDTINRSSHLSQTIEWITGASSVNKGSVQVLSANRMLSKEIIHSGLADGKHWNFVQQEGTFFKRSLWDKINKTDGFANLRYAGDWNLWRQFAQYTDIYQFKYPLASFSIIKGQLSQSARVHYEKETEDIISKEKRLNSFKTMDTDRIRSFYLSASYAKELIEIEQKNINLYYNQRVVRLKLDNQYKKMDFKHDRELLISTYKQAFKEQRHTLKNYTLIMDKIKLLTTVSIRKNPLKKLQHYKEFSKLFYKLKYKKRETKKVLIFASSHGNIYKEALENVDIGHSLEIEHVLSYENLSNYEDIKNKCSECDILIIQPVQNYEKWKMDNVLPLLKKDCIVIRIPFIRFNGYWDKEDVRELHKIKQPAVMFFPKIKDVKEVSQYITGNLDDKTVIKSRFNAAIDELKALEQQGDIKFVDFFVENHQSIPLFRDAYHPTKVLYDFITHQLINTIHSHVPAILKSDFSIPNTWKKEYGHFKPIDNASAQILGLKYDLDSYFICTRSTYLKAILYYENRINPFIIEDLSKFRAVLDHFDESTIDTKYPSHISNNCIAYDDDWQFPAITEKHAFHMIYDTVLHDENSIYIAFPWATLIDLLDRRNDRYSLLLDVLTQIKKVISGKKNIITVCQHVSMLRYQNMFAEMGITHIFWTHAVQDQPALPLFEEIKILPFPLYPVQVKDKYNANIRREYLYSFVGARAESYYLTQSRNFIIDILSEDTRGFVRGREGWHFDNVVYGHQIDGEVDININLVDHKASEEFQDIVKKSIFSLCPSGTGPNSIRLWESIGFGAIPVILADTYLPPGNLDLWDQAVVYCEETEEAIRALPDRLEEMAKDTELLGRKRHAMSQLWMLYGPECFVYDIQKLLLTLDNSKQVSSENFVSQEKKIANV